MFLAIAVLMIHPQLAPKAFLLRREGRFGTAGPIPKLPHAITGTENSLPAASATVAAPEQPAAELSSAALPDAPVPAPTVNSPAPLAYLKKSKPGTVSVGRIARGESAEPDALARAGPDVARRGHV